MREKQTLFKIFKQLTKAFSYHKLNVFILVEGILCALCIKVSYILLLQVT